MTTPSIPASAENTPASQRSGIDWLFAIAVIAIAVALTRVI
jgi:hypothetical protein